MLTSNHGFVADRSSGNMSACFHWLKTRLYDALAALLALSPAAAEQGKHRAEQSQMLDDN